VIGWSVRDVWADSLYFLYVVFGSICKTISSFQHFCGFLLTNVGCRKVGRSKLRWMNRMEVDVRKLSLKEWRGRAFDRRERKYVLEAARAQTVL
jgi:hypothetical protein